MENFFGRVLEKNPHPPKKEKYTNSSREAEIEVLRLTQTLSSIPSVENTQWFQI